MHGTVGKERKALLLFWNRRTEQQGFIVILEQKRPERRLYCCLCLSSCFSCFFFFAVLLLFFFFFLCLVFIFQNVARDFQPPSSTIFLNFALAFLFLFILFLTVSFLGFSFFYLSNLFQSLFSLTEVTTSFLGSFPNNKKYNKILIIRKANKSPKWDDPKFN